MLLDALCTPAFGDCSNEKSCAQTSGFFALFALAALFAPLSRNYLGQKGGLSLFIHSLPDELHYKFGSLYQDRVGEARVDITTDFVVPFGKRAIPVVDNVIVTTPALARAHDARLTNLVIIDTPFRENGNAVHSVLFAMPSQADSDIWMGLVHVPVIKTGSAICAIRVREVSAGSTRDFARENDLAIFALRVRQLVSAVQTRDMPIFARDSFCPPQNLVKEDFEIVENASYLFAVFHVRDQVFLFQLFLDRTKLGGVTFVPTIIANLGGVCGRSGSSVVWRGVFVLVDHHPDVDEDAFSRDSLKGIWEMLNRK